MKIKLMVELSVVLLSLIFATPCFAVDPPDTTVDVSVTTPGDVDLNVDINAGGSVSATIGGIDLGQTNFMAQDAYNAVHQPTNFMGDYVYYWNITGIGQRIESQIAQLQSVINLLANAQAMLIQNNQLTSVDISSLSAMLLGATGNINATQHEIEYLQAETESFRISTSQILSQMQSQDDKTWNQLMYGAEAHLAILQGVVDQQAQTIANLQTELQSQQENMKATTDVLENNYLELRNYTDYLQRQYLYYFWIMGGVLFAFVVTIVILFLKHARNRIAH